RNSGPKAGKLTLTAGIAAVIARQRHGMPCRLIGTLLGAEESTISLATRRIAPLLDQHGITITPAGTRISTLSKLREHAAGITLPGPPLPHTTPESTLQTPGTPQTHIISGRVPQTKNASRSWQKRYFGSDFDDPEGSFGIMNWTERSLNWGVHGADEAGVTKVRRSGAARAALRTGMLRVGTLRERALRTGMLRGGRR